MRGGALARAPITAMHSSSSSCRENIRPKNYTLYTIDPVPVGFIQDAPVERRINFLCGQVVR